MLLKGNLQCRLQSRLVADGHHFLLASLLNSQPLIGLQEHQFVIVELQLILTLLFALLSAHLLPH